MFVELAEEPGLEAKPEGRGEKLGVASCIVSGVNRKVDDLEGLALFGSPIVFFPFKHGSLFDDILSLEPYPLS